MARLKRSISWLVTHESDSWLYFPEIKSIDSGADEADAAELQREFNAWTTRPRTAR